MKKLAYRYQLLMLLIWIPCVMVLFKIIEERKVAAVFAGAGFLILPCLFLFFEFFSKKKQRSRVLILFTGLFLVFSALPIFLLRILNWNADFSQLSILGITADQMHKGSNYNYIVMVFAMAYLSYREWTNEKSQPKG